MAKKKPIVKGVKLPTAAFMRAQGKMKKVKFYRSSEFDETHPKTWEDADAELKADAKRAVKDIAAKLKAEGKAIPVESDKPGVARNPKPPKVVVPVEVEPVSHGILTRHFLRLMERLAQEQGGPHARALEDLRAEIRESKTRQV